MRISRGYWIIPVEELLSLGEDKLLSLFEAASKCVLRGGEAFLLAEPVRLTSWYRSRKIWWVAGIGSLAVKPGCLANHGGLFREVADDAWGETIRIMPFYDPRSRGEPLNLALEMGFVESRDARCVLGSLDLVQGYRAVWWDEPRDGVEVSGTAFSKHPLFTPVNNLVGSFMEAYVSRECGVQGWEPVLEISGFPVAMLDPLGKGIIICGSLKDGGRDILLKAYSVLWACGE